MEGRRKLVLDVEDGMSLSEACRRAEVTRKTGRKWLLRAREVGIEALAESSRAPKHRPAKTSPEVEEALIALKQEFGVWGAKKLVHLLRDRAGVKLAVRTADRILKRRGLVNPKAPAQEIQRFEREACGALLQMDFKGLPKAAPYALLTVLDDHGRYCHHFSPIPDKTGVSVQRALWEIFGEHGLPNQMLMDNGDCWGSVRAKGPTGFEAWLMRLGIRPIHGRPHHPQTQGKVERFHLTASKEVEGGLVYASAALAREACRSFVDRYNWVRPHEALGFNVPGSLYTPWPRTRPAKPPCHQLAEGAISRSVCAAGYFSFKGTEYRISQGLVGERVELREDEIGIRVYYAGFPLMYLRELEPGAGSRC